MVCLREGERPKQHKWALFITFCISECRSWDTTKALLILSQELGDCNLTYKHPHNTSLNGLMPVSCLDWNAPYKWMINPSSKKTPKPSQSVDQHCTAPVFDTTKRISCEYPSCTRIQRRKVVIWGSRARALPSTPQRRPELTSTGCIVASNHRLPWGGGSLHQ